MEPPLDLVSLDGSQTYWEIGKAIRQALRADPNTLEMLCAEPEIVDPMGEELAAMRAGVPVAGDLRQPSGGTRCRSSIGSSTTSGSPSTAP